ncbi:pRiA4b ORF-3-like protein [Bacillus oleivorans]|uniref:PRiA4b ORF-3-like protein n=1 Tax=Bacillus oleivorans TaxID=1448271 RepID=A0A285CIA2_9BACI|nr:plasmid pRiA4b ORF-3 family protein [Bacillus oleivorans]SNX67239.1 pRiA4b ORF-3-like protein [Bacillus oleivorans]
MIYQLKITLRRTSPPVWRRIEVDDRTSFRSLHKLIQIAFEWYDYHFHEFQVRDPYGPKSTRFIESRIVIGNLETDIDYKFYVDQVFDENHAFLCDWLIREKDKCMYVYDFGDYWEHEILLEKIKPAEERDSYPRCTKVMRGAPLEDSGGILDKEIEIDENDELDRINMDFAWLYMGMDVGK